MKLLSDKELKKLSPKDRQDTIIDSLKYLRDNNVSIKEVRELAIQLLKLYLLDRGESIDVDFSSDNFSNRINKLFSHYNHRDIERFLDKMDSKIELSEGVKLLMDKFKLSSDEATNIFKGYHGIGE